MHISTSLYHHKESKKKELGVERKGRGGVVEKKRRAWCRCWLRPLNQYIIKKFIGNQLTNLSSFFLLLLRSPGNGLVILVVCLGGGRLNRKVYWLIRFSLLRTVKIKTYESLAFVGGVVIAIFHGRWEERGSGKTVGDRRILCRLLFKAECQR